VVAPGSENTDLVQNLDFAETFLDIAGVAVPPEMQGRSIVPLLQGKTPPDWRKSIYYHYYECPSEHNVPCHDGVRTARYKLIHYYHTDDWELFDLAKDPEEMRSLSDDPAHATVRAELTRELTRLRQLYRVPAVDPPPLR
jgi:arylsulfatase A-like enzyme